MVEQLPVLPIVASLSVLFLLCSTICRRLSASLQGDKNYIIAKHINVL